MSATSPRTQICRDSSCKEGAGKRTSGAWHGPDDPLTVEDLDSPARATYFARPVGNDLSYGQRMHFISRLFLCAALVATALPAAAMTIVPPGNRFEEQPAVPMASANRTRAAQSTYEAKYRKVYDLLKNDEALRSKIEAVAAAYGIDPLHVAGAIVGEHT